MKRHDYEGYDCGCFCLFNVIGHSVTLRCYSGVWICVLRMCREVRCLGRRSNRSLSRRNVSQMIRWLTVTSERQASPQSLSPDSHSVTFGSVTKSAHDFQARKSQNVIPSESIQHCRFSLSSMFAALVLKAPSLSRITCSFEYYLQKHILYAGCFNPTPQIF